MKTIIAAAAIFMLSGFHADAHDSQAGEPCHFAPLRLSSGYVLNAWHCHKINKRGIMENVAPSTADMFGTNDYQDLLLHQLDTGFSVIDDPANILIHSIWQHACSYGDGTYSHGATRENQKCSCESHHCEWKQLENV